MEHYNEACFKLISLQGAGDNRATDMATGDNRRRCIIFYGRSGAVQETFSTFHLSRSNEQQFKMKVSSPFFVAQNAVAILDWIGPSPLFWHAESD